MLHKGSKIAAIGHKHKETLGNEDSREQEMVGAAKLGWKLQVLKAAISDAEVVSVNNSPHLHRMLPRSKDTLISVEWTDSLWNEHSVAIKEDEVADILGNGKDFIIYTHERGIFVVSLFTLNRINPELE